MQMSMKNIFPDSFKPMRAKEKTTTDSLRRILVVIPICRGIEVFCTLGSPEPAWAFRSAEKFSPKPQTMAGAVPDRGLEQLLIACSSFSKPTPRMTSDITIATVDANRSCWPPKPGRRLLSRVRRCRRRSVGGPSGPDGAPECPWGRHRVPYGSVHQSCTDTGQSSDPSSPGG